MTVRAIARFGLSVIAFGCSRGGPAGSPARAGLPACIISASPALADSLFTACASARARFTELLGETAFPATVLENDTLDNVGDIRDGRVILELKGRRALDEARDPMAGKSLPGFAMHELGHLLLLAHIDGPHPDSTDGYGSSLPDWLDEGVAMWMEPEPARRARFEQAASLPDAALDLLVITGRRHPHLRTGDGPRYSRVPRIETRIETCDTAICGPYPLGRDSVQIVHWIDEAGAVHLDTLYGGDPLWDWFSGIEFYTKVSTLLPFLHATGGVPLVREVLARIRAGKPPAQVFTALPGLPSDPAGVNREWIGFVRSLPRTDSRRSRRAGRGAWRRSGRLRADPLDARVPRFSELLS